LQQQQLEAIGAMEATAAIQGLNIDTRIASWAVTMEEI
jgi:hypothetical protein